ncbi:MAG: hypothetical protein IJS70_09740 [Bacteroidales bacterium]|nr:hypothetical protein [Bacteroidales bacterium]MBQ9529744.1 hypothetical protein [Bacteroidales bacterium]
MKKIIAIIAFCFIGFTAANAQNYDMAVGVEGGWEGMGVTFKQFTSSGNFMDYKANFVLGDGFGALASATYDFNVPLTPGFSFFYGLGIEGGLFIGEYRDVHYGGNLLGGFFGNIGAEYAFSAIPFAVSLDWNPGIRLVIGDKVASWFSYKGLCLGIKYTF